MQNTKCEKRHEKRTEYTRTIQKTATIKQKLRHLLRTIFFFTRGWILLRASVSSSLNALSAWLLGESTSSSPLWRHQHTYCFSGPGDTWSCTDTLYSDVTRIVMQGSLSVSFCACSLRLQGNNPDTVILSVNRHEHQFDDGTFTWQKYSWYIFF